MGINRTRVNGLSRQITSIIGAGRIEPAGQTGDILELPDLGVDRDGNAIPLRMNRHPHRAGKIPVG